MLRKFALLVSLMVTLTIANMAVSAEISYGVIGNGVYSNDYFNMSIKVPENWFVQSNAEQKELMELGGDLISGDNDNLKNILKEAEKNTVNLFSFFKYEQGAPVPFNPSIIAVAERVVGMPGIKRGSDYLFHVKKILNAGQMKYEFPNKVYSKSYSGVSFDVMPAEIIVGNTTVLQQFYATKSKDYVLSFVISYANQAQIDELHSIIGDLRFSN